VEDPSISRSSDGEFHFKSFGVSKPCLSFYNHKNIQLQLHKKSKTPNKTQRSNDNSGSIYKFTPMPRAVNTDKR